ncbi:hypothetical protein Cni_G26445 [Canna indica]|uniref:ARM repeat N-terminal plant domain-containing protein n=1 Tax=Canna indica TaxID=4628 RepID=A0AAQ3KZ18_9LILI|nr:hypothetical protein Cni_G26445 [Canna indica]
MEFSIRNTMLNTITAIKNKTVKIDSDEREEEKFLDCCFFCAIKEPNPRLRRLTVASFFHEMPYRDNECDVLVLSALWNIAMTRPDDPELPSLGALRCMSLLIAKAVDDPAWLLRHQHIYIPYYAAHVLGSYTIRLAALAELAVDAGAVPPLLDLLRGRMTWVEQRVAVRALGHLASYDATFPAVAAYAEEVVALAMRAASSCLGTVYAEFVAVVPSEREEYHRDLLTRGLGGAEMEDRRAEEWASQLQCWSLYLLCCFAHRDKCCHHLICRDAGFLKELCRMWGGLVNSDSPAGVGLMRILCRSTVGREAMARCPEVIESLCNLSRSSDDWQYMGVDCLLLLVDDQNTRRAAMEMAASCLVDLAELQSLSSRRSIGEKITKALLLDFDHRSAFELGGEAERSIKFLWDLKVERKNREEHMPIEEAAERAALAALKKKEGNEKFWAGNVEAAIIRYTESLELCPLRRRKERLVVYSNRAQCHLLMQDPDAAISDATRALALARPANWHAKSLWRRSQAYDMKGMARESLMDTIMFVNVSMEGKQRKQITKVPYYAARMINKQMTAAGLFAGLASSNKGVGRRRRRRRRRRRSELDDDRKKKNTVATTSPSGCSLPTIEEEPWLARRGGKAKGECSERREREDDLPFNCT